MALAVRAAKLGLRGCVVLWLGLTALLGLGFLGLKGLEYYDGMAGASRSRRSTSPSHGQHAAAPRELFYLLYFMLTGIHALHVTVGIGAGADHGGARAGAAGFARNGTRRSRSPASTGTSSTSSGSSSTR